MAADDKTKDLGAKGAAAGVAGTMPAQDARTVMLDPADALAATQAATALANAGTLVGATIAGRYQITKRLGEGGMGTVYQALHTVLEKQVALKVLHPELARKPDLVERFLQEAKAASRIRHENVIDISDFGSEGGHVFFAMEWLQGHDLHEEITRARDVGTLLPWTRTKNIFLQICNALSVAHDRGIVHRDLKPENVFLVEFRGDPDHVKLLDFGIAKMTDVSSSDEGRKLTRTGMLFGTPEYMAPEQARGEPADHRVDVYAMGCLLFLLVSGRLPFQADNFMGVLSQHLTDEPPVIAPETFDQIGAPRELAEVIDRALEKDREYRWQTIDELAAAICEVCGDPPPKERSRPLRVPGVAAPGETTRMRTPTDQPLRSRTPSGSQRMKSPTGPQRARTPTGPERPRTPTGPMGRFKPPTSPPKAKTPEVSWIGSAHEPAHVVSLGPVPANEQKGHAFAIVAGIFVVATIVGGAYVLGFFGKGTSKAPPPDVVAAPGSSSQPAPVPTAPPQPPPPALPDASEVVVDSTPHGATIIALPANTVVGKTPFTLTLPGSNTKRQYKLVLAGYSDMTIEVVPNQETLAVKSELVRATTTRTPVGKPTTSVPADTSTAVTKPDTSTAVTKPEPAPAPPPPAPAPPPSSDVEPEPAAE